MTSALPPSSFSVRRPAAKLARFVSQYWLGTNNSDPLYMALPDGCVDLVLEISADRCRAWAYGSTTRPTAIACAPGVHYLGIRFQPGQSRHFIACAASEITDRREELHSLMQFPLSDLAGNCIGRNHIPNGIATDALFDAIDRILNAQLRRAEPLSNYIDHVIDHVEQRHGLVRVEDVAAQFAKSRRQLERTFLQTVGVPLKFFCMISRIRHAAHLITSPSTRSLSAVAQDAGFSDQAHMTRDFTRLAGISPGRIQHDDAFFQYHSPR